MQYSRIRKTPIHEAPVRRGSGQRTAISRRLCVESWSFTQMAGRYRLIARQRIIEWEIARVSFFLEIFRPISCVTVFSFCEFVLYSLKRWSTYRAWPLTGSMKNSWKWAHYLVELLWAEPLLTCVCIGRVRAKWSSICRNTSPGSSRPDPHLTLPWQIRLRITNAGAEYMHRY